MIGQSTMIASGNGTAAAQARATTLGTTSSPSTMNSSRSTPSAAIMSASDRHCATP